MNTVYLFWYITAIRKINNMQEIFIKNPNLPQNKVSTVIISDYLSEAVNELNSYGVKTIISDKLSGINGAEAYHADMSVCHLGNSKFVVAKNNIELIKNLTDINTDIILSQAEISGRYPNIAALNVCIIGQKLICNTKSADKSIVDFCQRNEYRILHTNQGYTKCSCAVISENAVITSDSSIYQLCRNNKIDVLKISAGDIELSGYDYGFIGGTCGLIDKDILVFSGNIKKHKDYNNIKSFAGNYGINLLSLSSKLLYDVGGILPVKEFV